MFSNRPLGTSTIAALLAGRVSAVQRRAYTNLSRNLVTGELVSHDYDLLEQEAPELYQQLQNRNEVDKAQEQLQTWKAAGVTSVPIGSRAYPDPLRQIYDPPPILFVRGPLGKERPSARVAIVGSRRGDSRGCDIARQLAQQLGDYGVCSVSGLAYGIDAAAHRGALASSARLPTIAVFGCGLNTIYPRAHRRLASEILDHGGLLISQFEPSEKPLPHNFLNRNRVIAGLSSIVIVVQANERSGALVTARYAMEEGREVLAIPGAITDQLHRGTNRLIQQGAYLTLGIKDILELLPAEVSRTRQNVEDRTQQIPADYTHEQLQIMKLLQEQEQWHYDALAETLAEMSGFSTAILELELAGHLKRLPGNYVQASLKL